MSAFTVTKSTQLNGIRRFPIQESHDTEDKTRTCWWSDCQGCEGGSHCCFASVFDLTLTSKMANNTTDYETAATPHLNPRPSSIVSDCHQKYDVEENEEEDAYTKMSLQEKIVWGVFYGFASLAALYFFMVAVKLIGDGFTLALGCDTKGAFDFADNPVAGLMIGTIATALLHSSGTVTSIVVALVGSGGMTIRQGVYVVMGANIGTCITCIMVAFGQVGDRVRFQRAMAAATVHDMYNLWSVFVLFPLEVLLHPLEELSIAMSNAKTNSGSFKSPVDTLVNPLAQEILVVDKDAIYDVATASVPSQCASASVSWSALSSRW
ncbi:unnamed protein product [Phytophthora fragariaefolia]|uniref:Unnamed protein product n=1 Tax=Phytophthora fragariaefolia TaxID=1490495 RepID=A0A9W6YGM7_9STRA|nr:unnamed protein product [Phytophthora fragariaefolia]